jgi:hypothetical protein
MCLFLLQEHNPLSFVLHAEPLSQKSKSCGQFNEQS